MIKADWIAADWGTSNLRLWAMNAAGEVLDLKTSDQGMGSLDSEQYEDILLSETAKWREKSSVPVIACGMVGSRQGWCEAPYDELPSNAATSLTAVETKSSEIKVFILAGLKQQSDMGDDVMRGEETQIAGYIANHTGFNGYICLPGTHSKWARMQYGIVSSFKTVMTGEIFGLLKDHSILRHSLGIWDETAFEKGVRRGYEKPEKLTSDLFSIRARALLKDDNFGESFLSGLLIGAEIAGQLKREGGPKSDSVAILGDSKLVSLYLKAMQLLEIEAVAEEADAYTLHGLYKAYKRVVSK